MVDFVVGRCLDLLDIPHDLNVRWEDKKLSNRSPRDSVS